MKKQKGYSTALALIIVTITCLAIGGWIANIVKIVNSDFVWTSGRLIVRVVGIFIAPLGSVMGFL